MRRPNPAPRQRPRRLHGPFSAGGFTLLETMMALVVVGVGILAFVDAQGSFARSNAWSSHSATGMLLANEIREMCRKLPRHDPSSGITLVTSGGAPSAIGWGRESGETTVQQIDDIDDLNGMSFGFSGIYAGPIDAVRDIIPETDPNGNPVVDRAGNPVTLRNWRQRVVVEKVDPYNLNTVRAPAYTQAATSQWPAIAVDQFPLRVTVIVEYQDPITARIDEVTRLVWVVPVQ